MPSIGSAVRVGALLLAPAVGGAQVVRGVVVERGDSARVPGVVVMLLDETGRMAARSLTNERGEYRLAVGDPGIYRVRTLRIGYRPAESADFELRRYEEIEQVLALAGLPLSFDTIRVVARNPCRVMDVSSGTLAAAWEQVRTALLAARLTAGTATINATTVNYRRTLEASTSRVLSESRWVESHFVAKPWRSRSADSLRRFGYVEELDDGFVAYYAPDLDVLLSPTFVEDHCFRLASDRDPAVLGIAFEPTRDRSRIPEIRGTLWLDRRSSQLRSMRFQYANVSRAHEQAGAGGEMHFVRMGNGGWAISSWDIRMPVFEQRVMPSQGIPGSASSVEVRLRELWIAGGELSLVMRGRDTLWAATVIQAPEGPAVAAAPDAPAAADTVRRPAVRLDSVVVTAPRVMLSEFEERRPHGIGKYLTREDLEKNKARTLPDILSQLPGVRVVRDGGRAWVVGGRGVVTTLREAPPANRNRPEASLPRRACYADVYVNGISAYRGAPGEMLFDISTLSPSIVEGIEYYASAGITPPKYSRFGGECGTLLIWTRQ